MNDSQLCHNVRALMLGFRLYDYTLLAHSLYTIGLSNSGAWFNVICHQQAVINV